MWQGTQLDIYNISIEIVRDVVNVDDKVQLLGFGAFESKSRAAREGKEP